MFLSSGKDEKPAAAFGVKHSQYLGSLKVISYLIYHIVSHLNPQLTTHLMPFQAAHLTPCLPQGDAYVRARTETVKMPVQTSEEFRPR